MMREMISALTGERMMVRDDMVKIHLASGDKLVPVHDSARGKVGSEPAGPAREIPVGSPGREKAADADPLEEELPAEESAKRKPTAKKQKPKGEPPRPEGGEEW